VDIYFAPEKPEAVARGNWIETVAGKGFFSFYCCPGLLEGYIDKIRVLNDLELIE
jgi:hypothetical protein